MKIAVLVSGGVDSAVALQLLKEQGHDLTAFYLKIWLEDELSYLGSCPWEEDLSCVRAVCDQLDVPLEVVPLQREYHDQVVSYTIAEIKAGRTPNPDIMCNARIKFGAFLQAITANFDKKFDKIASGHYAKIEERNGIYYLKRSPDPVKDQTYFLSHLNQEQLSRIVFPIGHLEKFQVRELANKANLPNKDRKDSQGICFLGKFKFNDFLKHHLGEKPGPLLEFETGKKLGEHRGFWFHTIGQRQGIGLSGGPWYVVAKEPAHNRVYVSRDYYALDKKRDSFIVTNLHWLAPNPVQELEKKALRVKIRHGRAMHACVLETLEGKSGSSGSALVKLADRDQGLAPGQFAVFYDGDYCLGSGVIIESCP